MRGAVCFLVLLLFGFSSAFAQQHSGNLYWAPPNYTVGGVSKSTAFLNFIFWLTLFVFIAGRPFWSSILSSIVAGRARLLHYSHGNNFLEVVRTTIPVLIFLGLAIYSNWVWAELHSDPALDALQINVLAFRMNGLFNPNMP